MTTTAVRLPSAPTIEALEATWQAMTLHRSQMHLVESLEVYTYM